MRKKMKVDFMCIDRIKGNVIKEASIYVFAETKDDAETTAYKQLKSENSPNRDDIILLRCDDNDY